MKMFRETTVWDKADCKIPNHTYILESGRSGARALGYIKEGTEDVVMFSKPLKFDRRGRTFKEVK